MYSTSLASSFFGPVSFVLSCFCWLLLVPTLNLFQPHKVRSGLRQRESGAGCLGATAGGAAEDAGAARIDAPWPVETDLK